MGPRSPKYFAALIGALMLAVLLVPGADAAAKAPAKVTGLSMTGQDWYNAKIKLKWKAVSGATYQVRWAPSKTKLSSAKVYPSKTASTTSPTLSDRCVPWYAQVRAVKTGKVGPWSSATYVKIKTGRPAVPTPNVSGQTSLTSAQVRWTYGANVARTKLHWSAAPDKKWVGFERYTAWAPQTARSLSVPLPTEPDEYDRMLAPQYGNPVFGRLQVNNGCADYLQMTKYFAMFPKAADPGSAATGDRLAVASYNVEGAPTFKDGDGTKINNVAANIKSRNLDIVLLQEATSATAADLVSTLGGDWAAAASIAPLTPQQVLYRTSKYTDVSTADVGSPSDQTAATPLPTPAVRLDPVDTASRSLLVVSVHLEDRWKFDENATSLQRREHLNAAATALNRKIKAANPDGLPVIVGGDLRGRPVDKQGNVSFCDENTKGCKAEAQAVFVRDGYRDSQSAVTKLGLDYGTVVGHSALRKVTWGFAGRADYLLFKGVTGVSRYENVVKFSTSPAQQSDHTMIVSTVYIPFK